MCPAIKTQSRPFCLQRQEKTCKNLEEFGHIWGENSQFFAFFGHF